MVRPVRLRLILNLLLSRFFPASNQTAELLSTAAVFAIGFLMRPLGSLIMGPFADKKGRKAALTPSVTINHGR
ncbi:alpha-ketoglutarate transporter [Lactobacillus delbrueckii subsp. bulgaricus]|nr:alpha-ketoglutarate transporter [Lactobacillus delbrueckii subsp. bulgaricus]